MSLSGLEQAIYARQIMIPGWGLAAQEALSQSTVFIAGAGGLGSPASMYLAAAGVGRLRIADCDAPEASNLNRQILHDLSRIGINKATSARATLRHLNPHVDVIDLPRCITAETVDELVGDARVIVDCMDNVPTRWVLSECSRRKGIPMVYGSIRGFEGQVSVLQPPATPCYRCLVPEAPPKETFPVVGAVPGVIGSLQALETLKLLTGLGQPLRNRLLVWDGEYAEFREVALKRDPSCADCNAVSSMAAAPAR